MLDSRKKFDAISGLLRLARELSGASTVIFDSHEDSDLFVDAADNALSGVQKRSWITSSLQKTPFYIPIQSQKHDDIGQLFFFECPELSDQQREQIDVLGRQLSMSMDLKIFKQRQKRIIDHIPAMIAYWDRNLHCQFANRIYFEWFGYKPEELVGMTMHEVLGATVFEKNKKYIMGALEGETQYFERELIRKSDGVLRHTQATYIPDKVSGQVVGFFVLVTDVTELKRAEIEALQASKVKSRFLANVSHEIRTPLNGVLGMLSLALSRPMEREQQEYLEAAKTSANHLLTLIDDILDASKIQADGLVLVSKPFLLREVIDSVLSTLKIQTQLKGILIEVNVADGISDLRFGDPVRLQQVLLNLFGNAAKFTNKGSIIISVSPVVEDEELLFFEVKDTGIGVPEEMREVIFEPFRQADESTTRQRGGIGLGLSICKEIVEKMDGNIGFRSEADVGSTFYFRARLPKVSEAPKREDDKMVVKKSDQLIGSPLHLLIVEDDALSALVHTKFAESLGCKVVRANDGIEALEILDKSKFDFILMDMQMPKLNGIETTRRIRAKEAESKRHIPIVALTANAFDSDREHCLGAGMDAYISKPIRLSQLESVVRQLRNGERLSSPT
jgi:PAS domain S-box-containing protein